MSSSIDIGPANLGSIDITLAGEPMQLHADRALYWPARRRLLIADLHLGKGDVFRAAGLAVPSGGTQLDLQRIGALVQSTAAAEVWVLGDLLHGDIGSARWRERWDIWRSAHRSLRVVALHGNHDRRLDAAALDVELPGLEIDDGPFRLRHEPLQTPPTSGLHILAGHLHPVARLPRLGARLPAFWLRRGQTVLPAFSAFSGGWPVPLRAGEALALCAGSHIELLDRRRK